MKQLLQGTRKCDNFSLHVISFFKFIFFHECRLSNQEVETDFLSLWLDSTSTKKNINKIEGHTFELRGVTD